jgi:hypothetical protein
MTALDDHDAAVEAIAAASPPGSTDHERQHSEPTPEEERLAGLGAIAVLRLGLRATPELRDGIVITIALAVATAAGRLAVPVVIQQILDRGVIGDEGYRPGFVAATCVGVTVLIAAL